MALDAASIGVIVAAVVTTAGSVIAVQIRTSRGMSSLLADLRRDFEVFRERAVDRKLCDGLMAGARQDWATRCDAHREQCDDDRRNLRERMVRVETRTVTQP